MIKDDKYTFIRVHKKFKEKLFEIQSIMQEINNGKYASITEITEKLGLWLHVDKEGDGTMSLTLVKDYEY